MNKKPNVIISTLDAERLEKIIDGLPMNSSKIAENLEEELSRAKLVDPHAVPPTLVTMNSTVRFKVESSDEEFCMTLVYPKDVDTSGSKISILAPVGSAMIGLSEGDSIQWPKPGVGMLKVRVEEVMYQPERAGEFHR